MSRFRILGIEEAAGLDSGDPLAFPTGLTFVAEGMMSLTMTAMEAPGPTRAPSVVGVAQEAAEAAITAAGLTVGTVTTVHSATVPAGHVISQGLLAGASVERVRLVDLVVSSGPAPVTVPDVVGLMQADATAAVVAAGLSVGAVTTAHSTTLAAGHVISQNPAGGTSVGPGSAVDLVVSLGPAPVTVPNVVGLTQAAAETAITGAGLVVGAVTTAHSATVPAGDVISQNPAGGASVAPGTAVDLVVSSGPAAGFSFSGFFRPVENLPTINVAQAGQAIPLRFSLRGYHGLDVFAAGYPRAVVVTCAAGAPTDVVEEVVRPAGAGSLTTRPPTFIRMRGRRNGHGRTAAASWCCDSPTGRSTSRCSGSPDDVAGRGSKDPGLPS